jgi:hypothetical protein
MQYRKMEIWNDEDEKHTKDGTATKDTLGS